MTRIVAGRFGGRRLIAPPGQLTRPTADRVREALFSALEAQVGLLDVRFVDLFAGSGAVGLEALSRGAAHSLLVESDAKAARAIRDNIERIGAKGHALLVNAKVSTTLAGGPSGDPYDIVFADPPYSLGEDELAEMLSALVDRGWLAPDAVLVIERASRSPEPRWVQGVTGERQRRYGETTLWYGRAALAPLREPRQAEG
ncbi:16S rRNA (guanine(966)-N(2))-methyltransferase RsmD [Allocatelliglobosispora scoriae]|uniref:16S rRNA (guanine(966)-N(2))-methyltransferase RsmD n=1 Tax=Allocatelliglobosispora scoriae TaxID=643052 RepID=UPI00161C1590|nr:16S rRNA (guanine(966)-N(2))-methyltransferase RsmD [Allocatelliglobosispora scoriae]